MTSRNAWSLEGARALLVDVRAKTECAVAEVDQLEQRRREIVPGSEEDSGVEQALRQTVSTWVRAMEALGVDAKGAWLVDFDTGSGYYCWRWWW